MCLDSTALLTKSYPRITSIQICVQQTPPHFHRWCCFPTNTEWWVVSTTFTKPTYDNRTWVRRLECLHIMWQPLQVQAVCQHFYSNRKPHTRCHHSMAGVILPKAPWYVSWSAVGSRRIFGSHFQHLYPKVAGLTLSPDPKLRGSDWCLDVWHRFPSSPLDHLSSFLLLWWHAFFVFFLGGGGK